MEPLALILQSPSVHLLVLVLVLPPKAAACSFVKRKVYLPSSCFCPQSLSVYLESLLRKSSWTAFLTPFQAPSQVIHLPNLFPPVRVDHTELGGSVVSLGLKLLLVFCKVASVLSLSKHFACLHLTFWATMPATFSACYFAPYGSCVRLEDKVLCRLPLTSLPPGSGYMFRVATCAEQFG